MLSLSWKQVNAWRLSQHHLLERAPAKRTVEVVSQICGLHAQVMSAAELQLWARVQDLAPTEVKNALWRDRTLVKTWAMRGTLHLLDATELPAYCAALAYSVDPFYSRASWLKYHGVTQSELEAIIKGASTALGSSPITREQLATAVAQRLKNPRVREHLLSGWGALLKPVAHQGYLCFGPNQGQNVTFVRPEKWLREWQRVDPAQALEQIARSYLETYGPAPAEEFGRWWGIQPAKAKRLFKTLGDEIEEVEVEGWKAWALTSTLEPLRKMKPAHSINLLPNFDPYVVALYRQGNSILPAEHKTRVYREAGWVSPVVLVDGRIEGVWGYEKQRSRTVVRVEPFAPTTAAVKRGLAAEAKRLGGFLSTEIELIYKE